MGTVSSFLKSSGFYFVGNILSKLILFFLLPIYTTYIAPEDFGYYDVACTYLTLIVTFLFIDIYVAIMRFHFDGKEDDNSILTNGIFIFSCSLLLYLVAGITIELIHPIRYWIYIYICGIGVALNNLLGYLARAYGYNKRFATSGVVATFVTASSNILLIVGLGFDVKSLFISMALGFFVQIMMLEQKIKLHKRLSLKHFNISLLKKLFWFSLPLSLNSLAYWLLTGYSNIAISAKLGLEANGIYSIGAKFGLAINLFSTCFTMAWQEVIFQKGSERSKELDIFYSKAINLLLTIVIIGSALFIQAASILFPYLIGTDYAASYGIIPLCILAAIMGALSAFMGQIYAAMKSTNIIIYSTGTACLLNIVLVPLFIRYMGLEGAILAVVTSSLANVALRILLIRGKLRIHLNAKPLFLLLLGLSASVYVYYQNSIPFSIIYIIVITGITLFVYRNDLKSFAFRFLKPQQSNDE